MSGCKASNWPDVDLLLQVKILVAASQLHFQTARPDRYYHSRCADILTSQADESSKVNEGFSENTGRTLSEPVEEALNKTWTDKHRQS